MAAATAAAVAVPQPELACSHQTVTQQPAACSQTGGGTAPTSRTLDITAAAYTLTRQPFGDNVRSTLHPSAADTVDPPQLKGDFGRTGIHAKVTKGAPHIPRGVVRLGQRNDNGNYVVTVNPKALTRVRLAHHLPDPDLRLAWIPTLSLRLAARGARHRVCKTSGVTGVVGVTGVLLRGGRRR
jgi:hypothetical protein